MTWFERLIAKVGIAGLLAILLAASVAVNLWQFREGAQSAAECDARIAALGQKVAEESARADLLGLSISRETTERAGADADRIQNETIRYVERIREVRIPVPAECDGPMPDGVQDALADAAAASRRRL